MSDRQAHLEAVRSTFGTIARSYRRGQARRLHTDLLRALARPAAHERVLDVATGTGAVARAFAGSVRLVVGVDATDEMLREAQASAGVPDVALVEADAQDLPFADGQFDLVTCVRALHHMSRPLACLAEVRRVLDDGGRLLVVDNLSYEEPALAGPHNELETLRDPSHHWTFSLPGLRSLLAATGFEVGTVVEEEFLRPLSVWEADAGASSEVTAGIATRIRAGRRSGDRFTAHHFQRRRDGETTFRYRMVALVAGRRP
ncbi:MAG TPA: methyltransferase domain-containing protein [Candidatus Dormibacteraeota bacterium]|nr:methyltransferase domain-containing protein [Candidatus Dormibacteraeota bacterium]